MRIVNGGGYVGFFYIMAAMLDFLHYGGYVGFFTFPAKRTTSTFGNITFLFQSVRLLAKNMVSAFGTALPVNHTFTDVSKYSATLTVLDSYQCVRV